MGIRKGDLLKVLTCFEDDENCTHEFKKNEIVRVISKYRLSIFRPVLGYECQSTKMGNPVQKWGLYVNEVEVHKKKPNLFSKIKTKFYEYKNRNI